MLKAWECAHRGVGAARKAVRRGEASGCYKASCCHVWTVDCNASISEVHVISVQHMYMWESHT